MANKFKDMAGRFGKGGGGLGTGIKLLLAAGGLGFAATQSVYTGLLFIPIIIISILIISKL